MDRPRILPETDLLPALGEVDDGAMRTAIVNDARVDLSTVR